MGRTPKPQVLARRGPPKAVRFAMIHLQEVSFLAAVAVAIDVSASPLVPFPDIALNCHGYVTRALVAHRTRNGLTKRQVTKHLVDAAIADWSNGEFAVFRSDVNRSSAN